MNKIKNALYAAVAMVALAPAAVSAQLSSANTNAGYSGLAQTSITGLANTLMNWLLGILGFLAVIGFVISGILYLTAAGDEDQIGKAKNAMMYSIIGVIVALMGFVILRAAQSFFQGSGASF